jgi:hypothetical protein
VSAYLDLDDVTAGHPVALEELAALRKEIDALKDDALRYRWGVENARWLRHEHEAYVAIPVALDADLSCVAMRTHAIDRARKGMT